MFARDCFKARGSCQTELQVKRWWQNLVKGTS